MPIAAHFKSSNKGLWFTPLCSCQFLRFYYFKTPSYFGRAASLRSVPFALQTQIFLASHTQLD